MTAQPLGEALRKSALEADLAGACLGLFEQDSARSAAAAARLVEGATADDVNIAWTTFAKVFRTWHIRTTQQYQALLVAVKVSKAARS